MTKAFERLGRRVLVAAHPPPWEVHLFGTTATPGSRYDKDHLFKRVVALGADIRSEVMTTEEDYADMDPGDGGLDVVAYIPLEGGAKNLPVALAQCASGSTNWKRKQAEASFENWATTFHFTAMPLTWTIVPFCFHRPSGGWESHAQVKLGVLVDRRRLFDLIGKELAQPCDELPVLVAPTWSG